MKHLFIVTHKTTNGRYYCSFQNNNGDVLAESKFYPTREACTAAQVVTFLYRAYK